MQLRPAGPRPEGKEFLFRQCRSSKGWMYDHNTLESHSGRGKEGTRWRQQVEDKVACSGSRNGELDATAPRLGAQEEVGCEGKRRL